MIESNAFAPSISNSGLQISVAAGSAFVGKTFVSIKPTTVSVTANATNFVYLSLLSGTVQSGTGGFPANSYPIAKVTATNDGIGQLIDARSNVSNSSFGSETLGQKLRRLETAARNNNLLINPPLIAPAVWQANTDYSAGTVVSNGGNLYISSVAGTSAGNGGPSGTGDAIITDNTVSWYFYGLLGSSDSDSTAPSITVANINTVPSPYTHIYTVANKSSFFFGGGTPVLNANGYQLGWQNIQTVLNQPIPTSSAGSGGAILEFMTDAPVMYIANTGNGQSIVVYVDGTIVSLVAYVTAYPISSNRYLLIDFSGSGGRKPRRIRLEMIGSATFGSGGFGTTGIGVAVSPKDSIWPPDTSDNIRAVFVGDSYGGVYDFFPGRTFAGQVSKLLGWNDCWSDYYGGSGYQSNLGGGLNFLNRISGVTNNNPDVVVYVGGLNDSSIGEQAQALKCYQTVRTALPNTPIFVVGVPTPSNAQVTPQIATENALAAAVTQFADPLTFFIPVSTDPNGRWFTGSGTVSAPSGNGNNDVYISVDGTHPTPNGITYYSAKIANAIRNLLPSIP